MLPIDKLVISILDLYIKQFSKVYKELSIKLGFPAILEPQEGIIDDRIEKLDIAKKHLSDGIEAIEALKEEAQKNKEELNYLIQELKDITENKKTEEEKLNQIRSIITKDIKTFKLLAGIPNAKQLKREKRIGFVLGILTSIIGTFIIWLITDGYKYGLQFYWYIIN